MGISVVTGLHNLPPSGGAFQEDKTEDDQEKLPFLFSKAILGNLLKNKIALLKSAEQSK